MVCAYLGTIKGEKLNEPKSDLSPICQKKKRPEPGPNGLSVSGPDGLAGLYLVGPPFAWITASMRRGMEAISLWHCSGVMDAQVALIVAFRSSVLLGLVSLIFLLTIPHRFSIGFRSGEFAGQSSTVTPCSLNQFLVPLAVWTGAKSCWKMKSAFP